MPPAHTFADLPLTAQTAYAQLFDTCVSAEHLRSVADLSGSFTAKFVKGHKYWYYQYTEPAGKLRQIFVGPDNAAVNALIARKAEAAASQALLSLSRSAQILGCAEILPRHFQVLKRLAEYGFFQAGGVLVGTHAFIAYGNMLGVRWSGADASRTQDIDFAHAGKNVALALAPEFKVQTHQAIESLQMGFLPIVGLSGQDSGSYLIPKEPEFRLDFLTTLRRKGAGSYLHPDLQVTLQPLKFMEFSLEDVQQTVLLSRSGKTGAVLVNVPHPARFALHKLIIAGERQVAFQTKSNKDLIQAGLLLQVLKDRQAWDVETAWRDLSSRGRGWTSRAKQGLKALEKHFPNLAASAWLMGKKGG